VEPAWGRGDSSPTPMNSIGGKGEGGGERKKEKEEGEEEEAPLDAKAGSTIAVHDPSLALSMDPSPK